MRRRNYSKVTERNTNRGYKVPPGGVSMVVDVTIAMLADSKIMGTTKRR